MAFPRHGRDRGFSLVELVTIIAILGILVMTAMASYVLTGERSRALACRGNQRVVEDGVAQYQAAHDGALPGSLAPIALYVKWSGEAFATCLSAPYPAFEYDRTTGDVSCPIHPR